MVCMSLTVTVTYTESPLVTESLREQRALGQEMSDTRVTVIWKPEKLVISFPLAVGAVVAYRVTLTAENETMV